MASFNIFGSPTKDSVRVGYISTDRGYVEGVTICDANKYAQKNPGTQFIFKTRNIIKYLNINEVNKLTPNDALEKEKSCEGVVIEKKCGPAEALFYGGGGVGVVGNPIIGSDGAVLAVDLVSGGFGYQYPPIVEVKDSCGIGAGAVVTAVLGEIVETVEYYDQEGDFEDYNFDLCPPESAGYGLRYGPGGEVLGEWDPTLYATLSKDPIQREIKEYQDFLQQLQKPWWTTRKEPPLTVTSASGTTRIKYDVTFPAWSDFLNQFAISPVPSSNAPGSDFAGQEFQMEWEEEFPYTGEYVFRAQADNIGRFYLDNEKLIQTVEFKQDQTPKLAKKTVTAGVHRIRIDLYNKPQYEVITTQPPPPPPPPLLLQQPFNLKTTYSGVRDVPFTFRAGIYKIYVGYKQDTGPTGLAIEIKNKTNGKVVFDSLQSINGANIKLIPVTSGGFGLEQFSKNSEESKNFLKRSGVFPENVKDNSTTNIEWTNVQLSEDGDYEVSITVDDAIKFEMSFVKLLPAPLVYEIAKQSPTAAGVVYEGPTAIANYVSDFISPTFQNVNAIPNEEIQGKTWVFRWSNVDFPISGQYTLEAEADDTLIVKVDGVQVGEAKVFRGRAKTKFNVTAGKKTVELELTNTRILNTGFFATAPGAPANPVVGFAEITVPVDVSAGISRPWTQNPMGISAILIPPPCPRVIKGKGVVTRVDVDDPGNGYPLPIPPPTPTPAPSTYPVALRLSEVKVLDSGINHNCGVDKIEITPSNGAVLDYDCDSFGRIRSVKVLNPGLGFVAYPDIRMVTDTGINATFAPQFEVVRDPIVTEPQKQKLIQVTDLVGLKETGYVDGRAYYGAVFLKDGLLFAGFYETPGKLVQVYNTLRESIDAQVTTRPSAIQRQGTDVTSNDPRLNIPGTPDQII